MYHVYYGLELIGCCDGAGMDKQSVRRFYSSLVTDPESVWVVEVMNGRR